MPRTHSGEPYAGVDIAYETAWGTVATTGFVRVYPLIEPGESFRITQTPITPPRGMTSGGGRSDFDYGRRFVEGEITMRVAYNSQAFGMLLRELHGGIDNDGSFSSPSGAGAPTGSPSGYRTHEFVPNFYTSATALYEGGMPRGLTVRAWKSGISDAGTIDRWVGCLVTGLKLEQPENGPLRATFRFIGKQLSQLAATGLSITAVPAGLVLAKFRDFKNQAQLSHPVCPSIFKVKADLSVDYHVRSLVFDIDAKIELDRAPVTNPDDVQKPAHIDKWQAKCQVVTSLQQDYGATGRPHQEFVTGTKSALRCRWVSNEYAYNGGTGASQMPWALDLWLPATVYLDSKPNLSEPGNPPHPWEVETEAAALSAGQHAIISTPTSQWMIQLVGLAATY